MTTYFAGFVAYDPGHLVFKVECEWAWESSFDPTALRQLVEYAGVTLLAHAYVREVSPSGETLRGWGLHAWQNREAWGGLPYPPVQAGRRSE